MINSLTSFLFIACLVIASTAQAEYRCALLIGNSEYPGAALASPSADVRAMEEILRKRGFTVTTVENLSGDDAKQAVEKFADTVPVLGTAVVYFSGYALQGQQNGNRRDNYLMPVDGDAKNAWEVARSEVGVKWVLNHLSGFGGSSTKIVIVDGCYQHPQQEEEAAKGLLKLEDLPADSIVAYAAPTGEIVAPPEKGHAPFTAKLVEQLADSSRSLPDCLKATAGYFQTDLSSVDHLSQPASSAIAPPTEFVAGKKAGDEWVNRYGMVFCWCPPGTFLMGSPEDQEGRDDDEGPVEVTISDGFWTSKFELTRDNFNVITRLRNRRATDDKNHPASGHDIGSYRRTIIEPLNAGERSKDSLPQNWEYALPTEAQWEYAARAGTQTPYYFGTNEDELPRHGNFADRSLYEGGEGFPVYAHRTLDDGGVGLSRVGKYLPNPWGLHDVYGNMWEWCEDAYREQLPGGADPLIAIKPKSRDMQVVRGGCWLSPANYARSAFRHRFILTRSRKFVHDTAGCRLVIRPIR